MRQLQERSSLYNWRSHWPRSTIKELHPDLIPTPLPNKEQETLTIWTSTPLTHEVNSSPSPTPKGTTCETRMVVSRAGNWAIGKGHPNAPNTKPLQWNSNGNQNPKTIEIEQSPKAEEEFEELEEDSEWDRYGKVNVDTQKSNAPQSTEPPIPINIPKSNSRSFSANDDWQLNPDIATKLFNRWGRPKIDLFATVRNRQSHFYFRKESELPMGDGCLGEDALRASWDFSKDLVYANPPWELADKVIAKIKRDRVHRCILVLPFRNQILEEMSITEPIQLPHSDSLFLPPSRQGNKRPGVGPPRWKDTWAYLVTGEPQIPTPKIPKTGGTESKFLFRCQIDDNHAVALADSGCTAMVVSSDYVRRHKLRTTQCETTNFRFANNTSKSTDQQVEITFKRDNYTVPLTCFVAPIKQDIVLGTPWFESICIKNLDWRTRSISFREHGSVATEYTWTAVGKVKTTPTILAGRYSNPQAFLRHTEWAAVVNVEKLSELAEEEMQEFEPMENTDREDGMYHFFKDDRPNADGKQLFSNDDLARILAPYSAVFEKPDHLPPSRPDDHAITLTEDDKIPPWRPLGNLNQYELEALKEYITDLLNKGWIKHSKSPFGANILFAKKKDGSLRVVIDYRGLNNITIKDRTPLPNIKEMHVRLRGAKVYTKLDLRDGFNNILVRPEDQHKTAFRTRYGHFQYRVLHSDCVMPQQPSCV